MLMPQQTLQVRFEGRLDGLPEEALALLLGHDAPKNDEAISLKGYPLFGAQSAARRLGDRSGLVHERRSPWQGCPTVEQL